MMMSQPPNAQGGSTRPGATNDLEPQHGETSPSTVDSPPRHHLTTVDSWVMPTYLERLAFASVLAHVRNHVEDYPTYTVLGLRNLANAALDGIAPHFAAKDARIAELLGEVARLRAELDGRRFVQEDVTFERTADAASGADEVAR